MENMEVISADPFYFNNARPFNPGHPPISHNAAF